MFDEFLDKAVELRARGESFAIATVVRFEAPISGKPGDRAIVHSDGSMWGWIGGGCSQPAVIKEALKALQDGSPRLIRISPSANPDAEEGIVDYTMTCHSGGSLDIYVEPVLPKPRVVIFGRSVVAQTLARLANAIHYAVTVVDVIENARDHARLVTTPQTFVVVSTQGENDEEALEQALSFDSLYVAFVASETKTRKLFNFLREKGISSEQLSRVKAPAGLRIGAVSPEEIAVSILAEIVQAGRSRPQPVAPVEPKSVEEHDPVCGMTVNAASAKHKAQYGEKTYYFCCAGCKQKFDKEPAKVLLRLAE